MVRNGKCSVCSKVSLILTCLMLLAVPAKFEAGSDKASFNLDELGLYVIWDLLRLLQEGAEVITQYLERWFLAVW